MASLPDADRNKLGKALKDYYGLLFPEDESAKEFERTAMDKLKAWVSKSVELVPEGGRRFSLHME